MDENGQESWKYTSQGSKLHIHTAKSCAKCAATIAQAFTRRISEKTGKQFVADPIETGEASFLKLCRTDFPFSKPIGPDGTFTEN